jgi:L-alanine-DL-glutamate epimerase-like enolase superfamily enzyme
LRQGPPLRITAVETIHTRYPLSRPTGPAGGTDMALHDLCGKALGVPVHRLYGGALRQRVPVYASGLCYFPDIDPASC